MDPYKLYDDILNWWDDDKEDLAVQEFIERNGELEEWILLEIIRMRPKLVIRVFRESAEMKSRLKESRDEWFRDFLKIRHQEELLNLKNEELARLGKLWLRERAKNEALDHKWYKIWKDGMDERKRLWGEKREFEAEAARLKEYIFQLYKHE